MTAKTAADTLTARQLRMARINVHGYYIDTRGPLFLLVKGQTMTAHESMDAALDAADDSIADTATKGEN
jgi:hypothetical protein